MSRSLHAACALLLWGTAALVQAPAAPERPAPAAPLRSPESDPSLIPPGLRRQSVIATPRLDRSESDAASTCRAACATPYYRCLVEVDTRRCRPNWAACNATCQKVPARR